MVGEGALAVNEINYGKPLFATAASNGLGLGGNSSADPSVVDAAYGETVVPSRLGKWPRRSSRFERWSTYS